MAVQRTIPHSLSWSVCQAHRQEQELNLALDVFQFTEDGAFIK